MEQATELERLRDWRYNQFRLNGCDELLAAELAAGDADVHRFADLVAGGCPVETAARIVA